MDSPEVDLRRRKVAGGVWSLAVVIETGNVNYYFSFKFVFVCPD